MMNTKNAIILILAVLILHTVLIIKLNMDAHEMKIYKEVIQPEKTMFEGIPRLNIPTEEKFMSVFN